jgi:ribosomal protein S27AE
VARKAPSTSRAASPKATRRAGPATTPCPRCGKSVAVVGERGSCSACGLPVRFVDAPERPCVECGEPVALAPGQDAVRCTACGAWQAADAARPLVARATCPRCRREVDVPVDKDEAPCPRCGAILALGPALRDTL